jgi:hypothetical protein
LKQVVQLNSVGPSHTVTVVHSTTDGNQKTQLVVPPVTQLVPNAKDQPNLTVPPVSMVVISSMESLQVNALLTLVITKDSNVLKVGLYIKIISASEMIGNIMRTPLSVLTPFVTGLWMETSQNILVVLILKLSIIVLLVMLMMVIVIMKPFTDVLMSMPAIMITLPTLMMDPVNTVNGVLTMMENVITSPMTSTDLTVLLMPVLGKVPEMLKLS